MAGNIREIKTRFVVDGAKQYKNEITNIQSELKKYDERLRRLKDAYAGAGNGIEALTAGMKASENALVLTQRKIDETAKMIAHYKTAVEEAKTALASAKAELEAHAELQGKAADGDEDAAKAYAEYEAKVKNAETVLRELNSQLGTAEKQQETNYGQLGKLTKQFNDYSRGVEEASNSTDGLSAHFDKNGKLIQEFSDDVEQSKSALEEFGQAMADSGIIDNLEEFNETLFDCINSSIEFESAMTGVAKTTEMSGEELEAMGETFKQMSLTMPATTTELAKIAETGGQLGVAKEGLVSFTETIAALSVSTNMTAESAATMLSQFATITDIDPNEYGNLASAIVDVGNNFATTEERVTQMAQAVAGVATASDIGAADIIGLSTAVTSLGISANMGGTNVGRLIQKMQEAVDTGEGLNEWAQVAGMSAEEFAVAWQNRPIEAIQAFVQGLGKMTSGAEDAEGALAATLSTLGISEQRLIRIVSSLASAENNTGLLTRAVEMSNSAWQSNTALLREAELRYGTTESKIQIFKNSLNNLKIAVGDQFKPVISAMTEMGTSVADFLGDVAEFFGPIIPIIGLLSGEFVVLVGAINTVPKAFDAAKTAVTAFNAVMNSNPYLAVATAILAVITAIGTLIATAAKGSEEFQALTENARNYEKTAAEIEDASGRAIASFQSQASTATALYEKLQTLDTDSQAYKITLNALLEIFPDLNQYINEQGVLLMEAAGGWEAYIAAAEGRAYDDAKQKKYNDLLAAEADIQADLFLSQSKLTTAEAKLQGEYDRKSAILKQLNDEYGVVIEYQNELYDSDGNLLTGNQELVGEYQELVAAIADDEVAIREYKRAVEENTEEYNVAAAATAEYKDALEALPEGWTEADAAAENSAQVQIESLESVIAQYQQFKAEAYDALTSTVGMYDVMSTSAVTSIDTVMAAWDSQQQWFAQYNSNLENLTSRSLESLGISQAEWAGFIATIADGSEESAAVLAGMATASDEELGEMYKKFEESEQAKDDLSEAMGAAKTATTGALDDIGAKVDETFKKLDQSAQASAAAKSTMQTYIDELNKYIPQVNSILDRIGSRTISYAGAHAQGLDYVPYDDYRARLHEGEMVLNRAEARAYREKNSGGIINNSTSTSRSVTNNFYPQSLSNAQIDYIVETVNRRLA